MIFWNICNVSAYLQTFWRQTLLLDKWEFCHHTKTQDSSEHSLYVQREGEGDGENCVCNIEPEV